MSALWLPPILVKTVATCVTWYLVSSVTSQLTKKILIEYSYPLFLSQFQFFIGSILSFCFIVTVKTFPDIKRYFPIGSVPQDTDRPTINLGAFLKILPLGLFQFMGKYCSLSATSLISLAAVSSIKALSPLLIVIGYRCFYKIKFSILTYLSLIPLVGGVMMLIFCESPTSSTTVLSTNYIKLDAKQIQGLIYGFGSLIIFAAQNIYGKQLITWDSDNPTNLAISKKNNDLGISNIKQPYVRQRNNSLRLPYSTSDLNLEEQKNESYYKESNPSNDGHLKPEPQDSYSKEVRTNEFNIKNPFASLVSDKDKISKPDQMTTIFYCSTIGFSISFTGFVLNEFPHVLDILTGKLEETKPETQSGILHVFWLILITSVFHFIQTLLAFHLLGLIPAVSYSIASMMKRIFLITISIIMATEHDPNKFFGKLSGLQLVGLSLTGLGLYCYDRWGSRAAKAKT